MFSLCKTVKIYHTVNPHQPSTIHKDPTQLHFEDHSQQEAHSLPGHPPIRMVESHSMSPKKSRTGINLSLKQSSSSPSKYSDKTHSHQLTNSLHKRSSTNCQDPQSELSSFKVHNFRTFRRDSPRIIESKITIEKMSPRNEIKQATSTILVKSDVNPFMLPELPLKRGPTGTTQQSSQLSQPKIMVHPPSNPTNPLKRSTSFLRSSSRLDDSIGQSAENSLSNTIDFKFSNYKFKKEDASQSLLRLSCSSYSQIFEKNKHPGFEDFSQSCSLELKREEDNLNEYVYEVNESIILDQEETEKYLKIVKSNNDLLNKSRDSYEKQNTSNILEVDSPLRKMRKRYGQNMLHPFDKETLESKSFVSKSRQNSFRQIIDESYIIQHEIDEKFERLLKRQLIGSDYRINLAVEKTIKLLISIKQLPASSLDKVNHQLNIYKQIQNQHIDVGVIKLYQMYTQNSSFVLVKEPFEFMLPQFILSHSKNYGQIGWEFLARRIEQAVTKTIQIMSKNHLYLNRPIVCEDLVQVFDDWKLHSPDMFSGKGSYVNVQDNMKSLREEILGRVVTLANGNSFL